MFSFHLASASFFTTTDALLDPPRAETVAGLRHVECMTCMALGSSIVSPARMQLGSLAVFARWEDEAALDRFLMGSALGDTLRASWHVRLEFLRRWGHVAGLEDLPEVAGVVDDAAPVVAVTIARMKLFEVPRFIRWGKPVEQLVRDHTGTTLALAAIRMPRTVSTFSVWRSQREMLEMVRGRGATPDAKRHAVAMKERKRRDFHHEFTTLRFRALSEHGVWQGRSGIVPTSTIR